MDKVKITAAQYDAFAKQGLDMTPFEAVGKLPTHDIKYERPPNFDAILKRFGRVVCSKGVIFTYGTTIYNPGRVVLPVSILAHERVHSDRQINGIGPVAWWSAYLDDDDFRFNEELAAHRVEYSTAIVGVGRQQRRAMLSHIAGRLAGPLYGNVVSKSNAMTLVKDEKYDVKPWPEFHLKKRERVDAV